MSAPVAAADEVAIMSWGLFYCSVCAPEGMDRAVVERAVERQMPCGTTKGWTISDDPTFASGNPNPCPCRMLPGRVHWLLAA